MTTKTTQFTPGPWSTERDRAKSISIYGGSTFIGEVYNEVDEPSLEEQANTNLIAAAPAMYEALQNLLEWAKGNRGAREGNPYCKPEVKQALKVLASIQDKKDYIDADTAPQAEGRQA